MWSRIFALLTLMSLIIAPAFAQVAGNSPSAMGGGSGQRFVFGASPWRIGINGFWTISAGSENETDEVWLPPLPGGGWVAFTNFALSVGNASSAGPVVREHYPGNSNLIDWATIFTGAGGTGGATPCLFADGQSSATMTSGGFAFLWVAPSTSPRWLRYSITTPVGGKRPQGANSSVGNSLALNNFSEVRRWKSTLAASEKTSGAISGSAPFNGNGFAGPSFLLEPWTGQASVLMLADSIGQQDDAQAYFASARNMVGAIPRGLDDASNGRVGIGNFTNHGANMLDFMANGSGYWSSRAALIAYARTMLNGGRMWPFTAIWSELGRNDLHYGIAGNDGSHGGIVAATKARYQSWWAHLGATYPGVPIIQSTIPPYTSSIDQWTSVAGQTVREGPANTSALTAINAWIAAKPAPLALAVDWSAAWLAPDQGDELPRWKDTPFTASGGGVLTAAISATPTVSATNVGVTFSASIAPQVGEYLVIEPLSPGNFERIYVRTVTDNANGTFTVRGAGNYAGASVNFGRAHGVGALVRSAYVGDGVHPAVAMHMLMGDRVKAAKVHAPLLQGSQIP
jgi:hypothetical protein